jgi:hypothetical protein
MTTEQHPLDAALAASIRGMPDESERILRTLPPDDLRAVFNLGWHDIRHGRLLEGMQKLDAGRFLNCFGSPPIPGLIWRDQDLTNKTLMFRCEGGFGDQILNFRFAKDFVAKGARVVVACSKELMPLFSRHGFVCVPSELAAQVHYDYWMPAMSAAHVLGYTHETLDGAPYLTASPTILQSKPDTLKVGVRWSGNPEFEHEQHRRFDPNLLIDLHTTLGCTFYSLQRDENLIDNLPFADLRNCLSSWEETVSVIAGLDLVITSCTSIAHCAAALGVPTWIVVPVLPYYTWAVPGSRSAWYNSVRLFRQNQYGNWDAPFTELRQALTNEASLKEAA